MKKLYILFICWMLTPFVFAQQIPQFSQYMVNPYIINPAASGIYEFSDITLGGRWQWVGFGDEPKSMYLSGSTILRSKKKTIYNPSFRVSQELPTLPQVETGRLKHAVGGQFIADQYGAFRRMNLSGSYALHLPVSKTINLSFGTRIGLANNTFLQDKASVLNPNDPYSAYAGGDAGFDQFVAGNLNKYIMDISAGLFLYHEHFFAGVAFDHLSKDFVKFGGGSVNFNTQIHYNVMLGGKIPLNENFNLLPSVLLKNMRPSPISVEGSLLVQYKEMIWLGASYRHKDAVVGMFGFAISQRFRMGYSFDYSISRINKISSGGHELILGILLGKK